MSTPSSRSASNDVGGESFDFLGISGHCSRFSSSCRQFQGKWGSLRYAWPKVSGNVRRRPQTPLLYKKPRKPKKSGKRGGSSKNETLSCFLCSQSSELLRGGQVLLLQAVQLTRNNTGTEQRATFCKEDRVESLVLVGIRPSEAC